MNLGALEDEVQTKIGTRSLLEIVAFVTQKQPTLWGSQQGGDFVKINVMLILYKDLHAIGYGRVLKMCRLPISFSQVSFQHNARIIRPIFKQWAATVINLGDSVAWNVAKRRCDFPDGLTSTNLWIDSSDFSIQCPSGPRRKNPYYSHKNLGLARRYMMLADARGHIRKIWGGYSPKVYDGHFLEIHREWIEANLAGGVVVGDCHFSAGRNMFKNVSFLTPHAKKRIPRNVDGEGLVQLTKEQKKWNASLAHVRARIEQPFGWMKSTFKCLNQKWAEEPTQQDNVVWLAAAVLNIKKEL